MLGRALVCCGRVPNGVGLSLRGFIWLKAPAWATMDGEGRQFKQRFREGQTVHAGGTHSSSFVLPELTGPKAGAKVPRSHMLSPYLPPCSQCTLEQDSGDTLRVRS